MIEKQMTYKCKLYEKIKEDIITGVYSQGELLNERILSEVMGISRTPIREALQLLNRDGWIVNEMYKGAVVRTFEVGYVLNVQKVRSALEGLAIEDAILNIDDQGIANLENSLHRQEQVLTNYNPKEFMKLDREFHEGIYSFSQNDILLGLLKNLNDIIRYFGIQALMVPERNKSTLKEHQEIVASIKVRNVDDAKRKMEYHMLMTGNAILKYAKDKERQEAAI